MFNVSFSKPPSRNFMFIHLVYNEDKVISFLYIISYKKVNTNNLSKEHICNTYKLFRKYTRI